MKLTLTHLWIGIYAAITIVFCFISAAVFASDQKSIINSTIFQTELDFNNSSITLTVYPKLAPKTNNSNNDLILWLPSEHGLPNSVSAIANTLSTNGETVDVWVADLLNSLFLPSQASSINKVPVTILYELIKKVHAKTQKRIFIVASGKGALLAMRASHYWLQDSLTAEQFGGVILLYPNLLTKTPEPGNNANYYPVTHAVNIPIYILQPGKSPRRWQLAKLRDHLVKANARPYISLLANVRDRFFFRPDATDAEQLATKNLAANIQKSMLYLSSEKISNYGIPRQLANSTKLTTQNKPTKIQAKLRPYKNNPIPPALNLRTLAGKNASLDNYRNKVIIVNFWATWCPPCVHEMPSMEKIYQRYSKSDFTILAVNMAEENATIRDFVKNRVNVNFPILLDHDGKALQDWQVFAFPSSYVIDKHGKIRYALFGSIFWDTPQVTDIIDKLLVE